MEENMDIDDSMDMEDINTGAESGVSAEQRLSEIAAIAEALATELGLSMADIRTPKETFSSGEPASRWRTTGLEAIMGRYSAFVPGFNLTPEAIMQKALKQAEPELWCLARVESALSFILSCLALAVGQRGIDEDFPFADSKEEE